MKKRVLIISHELIGPRMAGPGIRYAEIARVLSAHVKVTVATPPGSSLPRHSEPFEIHAYARGDWESLRAALDNVDSLFASPDSIAEFPQLAAHGVPLAIDGYNPLMAEWLNSHADLPGWQQRRTQLTRAIFGGDVFFCASERQRDWWLGILEAHGRINPLTVTADASLRTLVDVLPSGLTAGGSESESGKRPGGLPAAYHSQPLIKGVWPGIATTDQVALWGGGLWPWLDPLTAIEAIALLRETWPTLRLVFPGTKHPNPALAELRTHVEAAKALVAAKQLGTHVFFGDWIAYDDWPQVLRESDVALSLHHDTYETRLAFRSRMLDYIGCSLPIVSTAGDATSEIVRTFGLGECVRERDAAAVAAAIARILNTQRAAYAGAFAAAQQAYAWPHVTRALITFCSAPWQAADRALRTELDQPGVLSTLRAENARLETLVSGYERGRFMRLMRRLKGKT